MRILHKIIVFTILFSLGLSQNISSVSAEFLGNLEEKTFVVSAYYSPEPNQSRYFKGSYERDMLLNGLGKVTASGNSIYKGAVAAPRSIPFGTLLEVDGVGFLVVEDRGSAIYDMETKLRLDLWTGRGEDSLNKALNWGIKEVRGWVYPSEVKNMQTYDFKRNLNLNSEGDDVRVLQTQLKALGFFNDNVTGFFGEKTSEAVYKYQRFKNVVPNREFLGAGIFGPGTRKRFNFMNQSLDLLQQNRLQANRDNPPSEHYKQVYEDFYGKDLSFGDTDYNVYILQQKLSKMGLFSWPRFTYQYGEATKKAVFSFQKNHGIVSSLSDQGAGVFGPATRSKMKEVLK